MTCLKRAKMKMQGNKASAIAAISSNARAAPTLPPPRKRSGGAAHYRSATSGRDGAAAAHARVALGRDAKASQHACERTVPGTTAWGWKVESAGAHAGTGRLGGGDAGLPAPLTLGNALLRYAFLFLNRHCVHIAANQAMLGCSVLAHSFCGVVPRVLELCVVGVGCLG
eukprot:CAMPEP_0202833306 /NCGR_PEP_ID=MMETSP1389-20130828/24540_1 /ASSEMBLY_ACC=CAM_ASM_000865 /TAXON_ID=302021 /ORGANISM="Rhodomonas sp., Strain CCMP768" /LENGTH=168 /DNA_ID=CAMNT_0049507879 /DNA_START=52 /DNA_END=555 /DNA_ORIENTATION=+